MLNVHRTTSPRVLAAVELTASLQSAVAILLVVVAATVAARRLAGALETPLGPSLLLVTAGLLAGLARIAHGRVGFSPPSHEIGLKPTVHFHALISLTMLIIAASLSLPGSHSVALLGFWTMIVGQELWAWRSMLPARRFAKADMPIANSPLHLGEGGQHVPMVVVGVRESSDSSEEPEPAEPAADVLQQLTLRITAEGGQELSGWLRMPLAAGQRSGSLHVAFCPAFGQAPRVEVEPVCGPDCRIKAAQVLPYGARLDVKLDEPARENESVLAWLSCTSAFPG